MKLYKYNFHANYQNHAGEHWAMCSYDVERFICAKFPMATGIYIWVV